MRQDHLTEQQILAFRARRLSASELLRVDDHLSTCSACRDLMWDNLNADRMVASLRSQLHSAAEPSAHIPARARRWLTPGIWAAAAALLAIGVSIGIRETHRAATVSVSAPVVRVQPKAPEALPPEYQAILDRALSDGKLDHAAVLRDLIRKKSTLLAAGPEDRFYSVLGPLGTVVLSDRPVLRWEQVPGARHYVVSIFDANYRKVAESPELPVTRWQPESALPRGKTYSWQIRAEVRGESIQWPRPPEPEAVFRILDAAKREELERVRNLPGSSHLLLGILYAREGLLDDAETELKLAPTEKARPLLEDLSRLRQH